MSQLITVPFTEDFLPHVVKYINANYVSKGKSLSRLAIVFGGRRPSLFLKRDLARLIGKPYVPPTFFTIDEWMFKMANNEDVEFSGPLDHCFAIFQLAQRDAPEVLKGRESFAQFLPWAREILQFIEQLDIEAVPLDSLKLIEAHAKIGFNVPSDINQLLVHLVVLRKGYHAYLESKGLTTRGYQYWRAVMRCPQADLSAFDEIIFCNFFYLHRSENFVIKHVYDQGKVLMLMQGDQRRWPALERIAKTFGTPVIEGQEVKPTTFDLHIYEATDSHVQAGLVKEILARIKDPSSSVIVLPNADALLPLLTAMGDGLEEFNISMGYPLKRSALYALLELMMAAQRSRRGKAYYAPDFLKLLSHPLVKSLNLAKDPALVRILVHRMEESLKGEFLTGISGMLFVELTDILSDDKLWAELPQGVGLKDVLGQIHQVILGNFDDITRTESLAHALKQFISFMQAHSAMEQYPFNAPIAIRLNAIAEEFALCSFAKEVFEARELFKILEERVSSELVSFNGSPLRGLQVLGLFETRALNFKNVIVLDVNEGALPNLNIYERLVPREVMIKLNLDRLELEEEIQRYGFMRLISSAQEVHLIYQQHHDKLRSRFLEELIWEQERRAASIGVVDIKRSAFHVAVMPRDRRIPKTPAIVDYLRSMTFSASSVNTYLRNPYEFYCRYVLGLRQKEDLLEDLQARHVGTFVHGLLEDAFKVFLGKKPVLDDAFKLFFNKLYQQRFEEAFGKARRSDTFLMKTVLDARLERFIKEEAHRCEKDVSKLHYIERRFEDTLMLNGLPIKFVYQVDRVDEMVDGTMMILDYKTGGKDVMPKVVDFIETMPLSRENMRDYIKSFQMPLYLNYLVRQYPAQPINAALYHLRTMQLQPFIQRGNAQEMGRMTPACMKALEILFAEIMDIDQPFVDDPPPEGF